MLIRAVIFDLDGTITQPYFDFDAIREEMGLDKDAGPVLEAMEKMPQQRRKDAEKILHLHEQRAVTESTLNAGTKQTLRALRRAGGAPLGGSCLAYPALRVRQLCDHEF